MQQRTDDASPLNGPARRHTWIAPQVTELPRLTQLTLQTTGIPGDCDPGDPSSCF